MKWSRALQVNPREISHSQSFLMSLPTQPAVGQGNMQLTAVIADTYGNVLTAPWHFPTASGTPSSGLQLSISQRNGFNIMNRSSSSLTFPLQVALSLQSTADIRDPGFPVNGSGAQVLDMLRVNNLPVSR
jgi:hypothetical protein